MTLKHIFARVICVVLVPWLGWLLASEDFVKVIRSSLFFDIVGGYSRPKFFGMVG